MMNQLRTAFLLVLLMPWQSAFPESPPPVAVADAQGSAADAEARHAEEALAAGDLDSALEHYMAATEMDPAQIDYLTAAAAVGEELGMAELAASLDVRAVDQAVAAGRRDRIAGLNQEITRLLSVMPDWVQEKLQAASAVTPEQEEGFNAWQEMAAEASQAAGNGDFSAAAAAQDSCVLIAHDVFGDASWITASSMRDLGYFYRQLGDADQAEQYYSMALTAASEALGDDHPQTLEIQGLVAELYTATGALEEAGLVHEIMVSAYESALGAASPFTLAARQALVDNYSARGMYKEATALSGDLCASVQQTFGTYHPQHITCLNMQASILASGGDLAAAEQTYGSNVNLMAHSFARIDTTALDTLTQLGEIYRRQGRYQDAKGLLQGIVDTAVGIGDGESAMRARSYLGRVFNNDGDYARAEALTGTVLGYARQNWQHAPVEVANVMLEYGAILQNQGRLADAENQFQEALNDLLAAVGDLHPSTLVAMNDLGQVYEKEGLYDQAEPILKAALASFEAVLGEAHPQTARARNNLALLYESQGNFREAEPLYQKTLALLEESLGETHNDAVAVRNNLAFLYMLMEEYGEAANMFEKVREDWTQLFGEDHQNTLKASNNLARVYHRLNRLPEAEVLFQRALTLRKATLGADHLDTLRSMIDLGALYIDEGKLEEADDLVTDALKRLEQNYGEQFPYTFEALNTLARVKEARNLQVQALALRRTGFERRTQFFDRMLWVAGENAREGYIRLYKPEQDALLGVLVRIGGEEGALMALDVSLQRKGLLLKITSEIQQIAQLSSDPALADLAAQLQSARKDLASLTLSGPTAETQGRHTEALYDLERRVNELQGNIGRASVRYRSSIAQVNSRTLVDAMEKGSSLVDFLAYDQNGEHRLLATVVHKDGAGKIDASIIPYESLADIESAIVEYRTIIQDVDADEDEIRESGQVAYDKVWQPIASALGEEEHVFLIPDGMLNILPFNALVDADDAYLIQTRDLHILTSGRDLLPNEYRLAKGATVIIAGPDYDFEGVVSDAELERAIGRRSAAVKLGIRGAASGLRGLSFAPLPGAEQEGRLITDEVESKRGESRVYFKKDAQEMVLAELQSPPEVLHMATHGFFLEADENLRKRLLKAQRSADLLVPPPGDNPLLRSGMAFAGVNNNAPYLGDIDTVNDGVLTALEVLSLNLTGTRLVVLSACETGLGEIHEGEGVYGLRRSFQEAGVAEVVSSLWEVSDAGTQALMTAFYNRVLAGDEPRDALRATQLEMLDSPQWGYPYVWSAFMIVGSYESAGYSLR